MKLETIRVLSGIYIIKVTVSVCVSVSVCLFSKCGLTIGPTVLIFGMEDHICPEEVKGYILLRYPYPWVRGGLRVVLKVHAAQTAHFCEHFIKQKLKGTPENGSVGWVRSGPRPRSGVQ